MEVNGFEGNAAGKHRCLIIIHSLLSLDAPEKQHMRKAGDDDFSLMSGYAKFRQSSYSLVN